MFRDQTMIMAAELGDFDEPTEHYGDDDFGDLSFNFDPNQDW